MHIICFGCGGPTNVPLRCRYNPVPSAEYDTASLIKTRAFEIETLRKWITEARKEREATARPFETFYF